MVETKTCRVCNIGYPATTKYFYKNKSSKDGLHPWCKKCSIEKSRQKQLEKHDEYKEYWRNRFNNLYENDPNIRERQKNNQKKRENKYEIQKEWQQNNPDKIRQYRIERFMHKKHDITEEEWERCKDYFDYKCAYCDISEPEAEVKYKNKLHKDHANPNGSNDISNCIPACKSCNSSKHDSELEQWFNNKTNTNYTYKRNDKINNWLLGDYLLSKNPI